MKTMLNGFLWYKVSSILSIDIEVKQRETVTLGNLYKHKWADICLTVSQHFVGTVIYAKDETVLCNELILKQYLKRNLDIETDTTIYWNSLTSLFEIQIDLVDCTNEIRW